MSHPSSDLLVLQPTCLSLHMVIMKFLLDFKVVSNRRTAEVDSMILLSYDANTASI
jgi:hypothetical protein